MRYTGAMSVSMSLLHHLKDGRKEILPSAEVRYSPADSLSFIRGGNFFTSAIAYHNGSDLVLLQAETHYNRLKESHNAIYSRRNLPFSYETFLETLDVILKQAHEKNGAKIYDVIITLTGGKPLSFGTPRPYSSGFGGRIEKVLITVAPLDERPPWCFHKGINIKTYEHQRLIPEAKVTSYLGGIRGQHTIDAINVAAILCLKANPDWDISDLLNQLMAYYAQLDEDETDLFHEITQDLLRDLKPVSDTFPRFPFSLVWKIPFDKPLLDEHYENLLHETLFVSPEDPNEILEGTTYAILGIDASGAIRVTDSDNVLTSTNVLMIEKVAQTLGIPLVKKPLYLSELGHYQNVFIVSAKRIQFKPDMSLLMPVRSINGKALTFTQNETLMSLQKGISRFVETYKYQSALSALL